MFKEILTDTQINLLSFLKRFKKEYYLVGGTAIALYIGHRRSIDYDLFSAKPIQKQVIKKQLIESGIEYQLRYEDSDQLHIAVMGVKITFFQYPFHIPIKTTFENTLNLPDLLDLAAMKAYAFGMRAKWKDYIDIYFLLKSHFTLKEICEQASAIYENAFSEKLFRQQLCYFGDIDYSEQPEYMRESIPDNEICKFLIDISTTSF
ncbi:MAG: hypothetical protein EHJ94_10650 [Deltaproteobacteria bacterium]|nr:MAG: hypothetical protein EHJ94_10650 [Deltaproteobacteria bacterium]